MAAPTIHSGTSGFSYKEWKGHFYPDDLPAAQMLAYYAERLPSVEINNTFYRLPRRDVLESWAEQVPDAFRFVIKASRRITHFKRLKPPYDEVDYLLETLGALGGKMGAILFQLPPDMKKDTDRLEAFLQNVPDTVSAAFEFRNDSWFDSDVTDLLREHGRALVHADTEEKPVMVLEETADWGYLRLRRPGYTEEDLAAWAERLAGTGWKRVFVFFKHEEEGAGPRMASRFQEMAASK